MLRIRDLHRGRGEYGNRRGTFEKMPLFSLSLWGSSRLEEDEINILSMNFAIRVHRETSAVG